jgi:hypothetical protein
MNLLRVATPVCVTLAVVASALPLCATRAAEVPGDLGVSAEVQHWRVQLAVQYIAKDCTSGDLRVLYYADASQPGLFKVRTSSELGAVLDTRLSHVALGDWSRSYAGAAIGPIAYGTDVAHVVGRLGAQVPPPPEPEVFIGLPVAPKHIPASELRLPHMLDGVTVEEALDQEAKAFRGIATVAFCEEPRLIEFELTDATPGPPPR